MRAGSLSAFLALAASLAVCVDSAAIPAQPWRMRERSADLGDVSGSLAASTSGSSAGGWSLYSMYEGSDCSGSAVTVLADAGCFSDVGVGDCQADHSGSSSKDDDVPQVMVISECATDLPTELEQIFEGQTYVRIDFFVDDNCSQFETTNAYIADDKCHAQIMTNSRTMEDVVVAQRSVIDAKGVATTTFLNTTDCSGEPTSTLAVNKTQLASNQCANGRVAYTNADLHDQSDGAGSLAVGTVTSLVAACVALLL